MTPSCFLLLLLVLGLSVSSLPGCVTAQEPCRDVSVEATCRNAAVRQRGFNYQLCVDRVQGDPNPCKDLESQVAAAVFQARLSAEAAWSQATVWSQRGGPLVPLLDGCVGLYADLRDSAQDAITLLQNDQEEQGRNAALVELARARDRAHECTDAFSKSGKPSPLAAESSTATDMFVIAVAMLVLLVP